MYSHSHSNDSLNEVEKKPLKPSMVAQDYIIMVLRKWKQEFQDFKVIQVENDQWGMVGDPQNQGG